MYNTFFNLREKPFQLVPNPEFLFLGKSHEDALAHLTYAVSQGDGFVKITGEVGTGKTTLCRVFLETLGPDTKAAFIFNSQVNATQLLKMVHRELGITSTAEDPADLTHDLNKFLLEKKSAGTSVILLIDEAQNLEKETLEQLRMLSNLETTRSKLLQIILVGQPELRDVLDDYELRQLRQRINVSCHIRPLNRKETLDYISHRISVASNRPQSLFTPSALKRIYSFSKGVPRLINIICDRALLVAYSRQRKKVTTKHVGTAVREMQSVTPRKPGAFEINKINATLLAMAALLLITLGYTLYTKGALNTKKEAPPKMHPGPAIRENAVPLPAPAALPETAPVISAEQIEPSNAQQAELPPETGNVKDILWKIQRSANREKTFSYLASLWGKTPVSGLAELNDRIAPNTYFFKIAAGKNDLNMLTLNTDLKKAVKLNLPVLFEFKLSSRNEEGIAGIERVTVEKHCIIFTGGGHKKYSIPFDDLNSYIGDKMYIAWEDGLGNSQNIRQTAPKDAIITLKLLLSEMGFDINNFSPEYDQYVRDAVKTVQREAGLAEDGIAGPETRIALLQKLRGNQIPQLSPPFTRDPS